MAFHKVHCPRCGRVISADQLAFDFGDIINDALEKLNKRIFGRDTTWYDLIGFRLCLYLTLDDLISDYGFTQGGEGIYRGTFHFTTDHLIKHILKIANWPGTKIEDLISNDDHVAFGNLTNYMSISSGDFDRNELRDNIQMILTRANSAPQATIVKFDVEVYMATDDHGQRFANRLLVIFDDGERKIINKFVCQGDEGRPCGKTLYGQSGLYHEIVIGLAGTARVGKTAYLASIIASLMRKGDGIRSLGHPQNVLTYLAFTGEGWDTFNHDLLKPYMEGRLIPKTAVIKEETTDSKETIPMFSLTFQIKTGQKTRNIIFTFVDMPGEVYDGQADFVMERRIIQSASMIWFCIAPSQVEQREVVAAADQVNINLMNAFTNIRQTMEAISMIKKIPAVVLITRSDEVANHYRLFNASFNPYASSQNPMKYFDEKNEKTPWLDENGTLYYDHMKWFIERSANYLDENNNAISATIQDIFGYFTPFAVASYGFDADNPYADERDNFPNPSMIEGPFLWTLAYLGILPCCLEDKEIRHKKQMLFFDQEYEVDVHRKITAKTREQIFYKK